MSDMPSDAPSDVVARAAPPLLSIWLAPRQTIQRRDNSTDSRVLSAVGTIPLETVVRRVGMIFLSRAGDRGGEPSSIRHERIGMVVH
jgi:hypothetical protein